MANSINKLIDDKIIKRGKTGMLIRLDDIHVQEGFNKRVESEYSRSADDELFNHLAQGKPIPPLEVWPRDEGGVSIVEGHRRHRAFLRCRDSGKPVEWIPIIPFTGNNVERVARIMNSNSQLPLTPYEQSLVVKELAGFNLSPSEIAALVGKSRPTVDKLLAFSQANHDVQTLVKDGSVAVDVAVNRVKKHGEAAGKVLAGDVERARKAGKKKVTKAFIAPKFSQEKEGRIMELLEFANHITREEGNCILLPPDVDPAEVISLQNDYRKFKAEQHALESEEEPL